jgi:carboxylate-amine ligase
VEVRVCDVCTDPDHAVMLAALVRGLVETAARAWQAGDDVPRWRAEQLRACQWRAGKFGVSDTLVDPVSRELRRAREVLDALVAHVGAALEDAGDLDTVTRGIQKVLAHSGASAQRSAYERTGHVIGVVDDLIARTRASWNR